MNYRTAKTIALFILFVGSQPVHGDETKCLDVLGDVDIIAKISANRYEVSFGTARIMRDRMVLITEGTRFSQPGRSYAHMWIEDKIPEFIETTTNGFSRKVRVIRESMVCDKQERPKMQATEKSEREETEKRRALTLKKSQERQARMQKERDRESKMTPAEKEEERQADREEAKAIAQKQAEQQKKKHEAWRKQGEVLDKQMTAWFSMPIEKRHDICIKMFKGTPSDCDGMWVPPGNGLDRVFPN